jgi:hypothetical protein
MQYAAYYKQIRVYLSSHRAHQRSHKSKIFRSVVILYVILYDPHRRVNKYDNHKHFLSNSFPRFIYIPSVSKFSKAANLFKISTRYRSLALFLETEPLHMNSACCLFTHCQPFPNLCHHQVVVSITICCPE